MKICSDVGVQPFQLAISSKAQPREGCWEGRGMHALPNRKMGEAKTGMYCVGVHYQLEHLTPLEAHTVYCILAEWGWQPPGLAGLLLYRFSLVCIGDKKGDRSMELGVLCQYRGGFTPGAAVRHCTSCWCCQTCSSRNSRL